MRILFSLLDSQVGGGQRVAHLIARELRGRGHEIGVMAPSFGPAIGEFATLGAAFHRASIGSLRDARETSEVVSVMRGYDTLYSHTSIPGQILGDISARLSGRSHVVHQHTVPRVSPSAIVGTAHRNLYRATVARRPIITVAPHVRKAVLALGARPALTDVVPNGVDVDALRQMAAGTAGHDGVRVGVLARFDPQKGFDVFLETAAAIRDAGATFVIGAAGSAYPEHERHVRAEAARLTVDVVDPGVDGASFLAGLDIVLMPSLRAEGLPLTLLEAMALGKAIVASDVPGIGSIPGIADAARLIPIGDNEKWVGATRALIDDPEARLALGARAAEMVEHRFRASETAQAAADIVERSLI